MSTTTFTSYSGNVRTIRSDASRKANFIEIPIISLSTPKDELFVQIRDACTRVGFFYLKDHGVPQEVIDKVFAASKKFFGLTIDEKKETHYSKNKLLRGYEGPKETITDLTRKPDLNESFNFGYEPDLDPLGATANSTDVWGDNRMQGPNYWPSSFDLKSQAAPYYGEALSLGRRLIRLFALALNAPEHYFDNMFRTPGAMLRLIHYPPQQPDDPTTLGIGAHQDIECFTILCQGDEDGLQICNSEGEWIEAPAVKGTFVVNVGDMMSRWSNDEFTSTLHRVINKSGRERYSMPFFFGPSYETMIEPLTFSASGMEKRDPHYKPVQAGDYVWKRLAKQKLDGSY